MADIICAKCGRHLRDIVAAREHQCIEPYYNVIRNNKIYKTIKNPYTELSAEEWTKIENALKKIEASNISQVEETIKSETINDSSGHATARLPKKQVSITKNDLSIFWRRFKKTAVFLSLLGVTGIIVSSVSLIISGATSLISGVIFGVAGLSLSIWCTDSLSYHTVTFARFFLIVVVVLIFAMAATAYLDIRSISDVGKSIVDALSIVKVK